MLLRCLEEVLEPYILYKSIHKFSKKQVDCSSYGLRMEPPSLFTPPLPPFLFSSMLSPQAPPPLGLTPT